MALPANGAISIGGIRAELDNAGTSSFALSKAGMPTGGGANRGAGYTPVNQSSTSKPNKTSPYAISEWYSYNHTQNTSCSNSSSISTATDVGAQYYYYRINVTGTSGQKVSIQANILSPTGGQTYLFKIYSTYPFNTSGTLTGGTLLSTLTFTSTGMLAYLYTLASSSDVLYLVMWNDSIN